MINPPPQGTSLETTAEARRRRWVVGFLVALTLAMLAYMLVGQIPGLLPTDEFNFTNRVVIPLVSLTLAPAFVLLALLRQTDWAARGAAALILLNSAAALASAAYAEPGSVQVGLSAAFMVFPVVFVSMFLPTLDILVTLASVFGTLAAMVIVAALPIDAAIRSAEFTTFFGLAAIVTGYLRHRDVADLRGEAEQRIRLTAKLVVADRMAGIGLLAAGVAHDLRNTLTGLVMNADMARTARDEGDDPELDACLDGVDAAAIALRDLTHDLARVGRAEQGAPHATAPAKAIETAARLSRSIVGKCADLVIEAEPAPLVAISEVRLQQVLVNVIQNAAQAITEADSGVGHTIRIRTGTASDGAFIEVTDDGPGISEPVMARIFDPFFTTRDDRDGTGLGLYVTREIVQACGGDVTVRSAHPVGAKVRITLPAAS